MKNFNAVHYAIGLVGLFVTVYIARKAWEKAGESTDTVPFQGRRR
tara:strand:+ start:199 stop:333 length:135 start_codon:yes stop_codon:yes gene_type:complete